MMDQRLRGLAQNLTLTTQILNLTLTATQLGTRLHEGCDEITTAQWTGHEPRPCRTQPLTQRLDQTASYQERNRDPRAATHHTNRFKQQRVWRDVSTPHWRGATGDTAGAKALLEDLLRDQTRLFGTRHPSIQTTH